jgi:hypothetical protein
MTIRPLAISGIDRREFGVVHREILSYELKQVVRTCRIMKLRSKWPIKKAALEGNGLLEEEFSIHHRFPTLV